MLCTFLRSIGSRLVNVFDLTEASWAKATNKLVEFLPWAMQHAPEESLEIHLQLLFFFQSVTWEKAKSLGQDLNKGNVLESDLAFCAELRTVSKLGKSLAALLPGRCASFTGLDCRDWPSIFLARSCLPCLISNLRNHKEYQRITSTIVHPPIKFASCACCSFLTEN